MADAALADVAELRASLSAALAALKGTATQDPAALKVNEAATQAALTAFVAALRRVDEWLAAAAAAEGASGRSAADVDAELAALAAQNAEADRLLGEFRGKIDRWDAQMAELAGEDEGEAAAAEGGGEAMQS